MGGLGSFTLGVVAALVAGAAGPTLGRRLRPLVRGAVKQAIILTDGARVRTTGLQEDLEDLIAEARAEIRQSQAGPTAPYASPGTHASPPGQASTK